MRTLTPSAILAFAHCPYRYYLSYLLKIFPIAYSPAVTIGKGLHAGIGNIQSGAGNNQSGGRSASTSDAMLAARAAMKEDLLKLKKLMDPDEFGEAYEQAKRDRAKVCAMLRAYSAVYPRSLKMIETEGRFDPRPITNPATGKHSRTFNLAGIFDGLYQLEDGRTILYELKSTSDSLKEASRVLSQSIQTQLYLAMLPPDLKVAGICIDIVKKPVAPFKKPAPKTKKATTEVITEPLKDYEDRCYAAYLKNPQRFFRRIMLSYQPSRIRDALGIAWRVAQGIRDADKYGYLACRGNLCKTSSGWCGYRALCWYDDTENYQHGEWAHDELELAA